MRTLRHGLLLLLLLAPTIANADVRMRVPVVTQVQGAVFYRTSITLANASSNGAAGIALQLVYRSPADGTIQRPLLREADIPPNQVIFIEDIIQHFKDGGVIRAADANAALFGTLLVTFLAGNRSANECLVEARTYSPANGGGTNAIAYVGRQVETEGSEILKAAVRNGTFGTDGTTRANIGFVNAGSGATDIGISFRDGSTGDEIRQFVQDDLQPGEVVQLNNIFSSVPAGTRTIIVRAQALSSTGRISGYAVQLDSVTNDGAFFLFAEEDDDCSSSPGL